MSAFKHQLYANLDPLAHHFAVFICQLAASRKRTLYLAALAASLESSRQHTCADLQLLAGQAVSEHSRLKYPEYDLWIEDLQAFPEMIGQAKNQSERATPLVLEGSRLYLQRYWDHEEQLAQLIQKMLRPSAVNALIQPLDADSSRYAMLFQNYFQPTTEIDWQALACANALFERLSIIAGGPGTGKTTTVAKLLAIVIELQPGLKIALAAPTGKAAMRMKQALESNLNSLPVPAKIKARIENLMTESASTLHRLLGYIPNQVSFRHNAENPLPWDLVIVDESSMIDLGLMRRLFEAIPEQGRLILLGDPFQLASVETGSVLGDICQSADPTSFSSERLQAMAQIVSLPALEGLSGLKSSPEPVNNLLTELKVSHRFKAGSAIDRLARAINTGAASTAIEILQTPDSPVQLQSQTQDFSSRLLHTLATDYSDYFASETPQEALSRYENRVFLCALRRGPWGVEGLNQTLEQGFVQLKQMQMQQAWYHLRPVLIMENDYTHHLYNGDIGICWQDATGLTRVWFQKSDGSFRSFAPAQLGKHETAWALTVHKSQGSEFQNVSLILPDEIHPLLSRELIYTAITRARQTVQIYAPEAVLRAGIEKNIQRASGLHDKLVRL